MQEFEQKQIPKKSYFKIGAAITAIVAIFGIAIYSTPNLLRGDLLPGDTVPEGFAIRSESFIDGDIIPIKHSCGAEDNQFVSPGLQFFNVPEGTKSLFLEVFDIDANFRHWVVGNIPPTTQRIGENQAIQAPAVEGVNNFNFRGYGPNCPPPFDGAHRYVYTLYALDIEQIDISAFDNGQARVRPQNVFGNNIIAETKITGLFEEELLEGSTLACKENDEVIEENVASVANPQTQEETQLPIQTKKVTSTKTIALLNGPQKTEKNICSKTIESSTEAPFRAKTTELCKQEIVNQNDGTCKITCRKAGFAFLFGLIGVPPVQEETFEGTCDLDNSGSSDIEEINTILDNILGSELQASLFIHTVYAATNGDSAIEKDINLLKTLDLNDDTDRQQVETIKADRQKTLDLLNEFVEAGFNFARLQEGIQKLNDHIAQLQEALDNPPEPEEKPEQPAPEENTPPEDSNQPEPPIVPTGGTDINQVIQNFIESKDDAATEEDCANVGNKRIGIIGGPGRLTTIHMAQRSITTFSTENGEVTSDGTPGEFQDVFGPQTLNRCNSESIVRQVGLDPNNFGDQKARIKIGLVESTSSQSDTVEVLDFDPKTGLCTIARTFTSSSNVPDHETTRSGTISGRTIIEFAKGSVRTKRQITVMKGFCDLDGQRDIDIFKFHTFHIDSLPPAFASLKQLIALNKALEEINALAQGTNNAAEITTLGKQKIEELKEAFEVIRQDTEKELRANKPFVQYNGPRAETEEGYEETIANRSEGKFSNFIGTLERTINTIERGNVGFGKQELASLLFKIQNTELQSTIARFKAIFDLKILEDRFRGDVGDSFIQHFQSDSNDYIKRLQKIICSNTSATINEILQEIISTEKIEQGQYIADVNAGTEDAVYAPSPLFGFVNIPNLNHMPFLAKIVNAIETGLDTCEVEEIVEQCALEKAQGVDKAVNDFQQLNGAEQQALLQRILNAPEVIEALNNQELDESGKVLGISTQLLAQANDQSLDKQLEELDEQRKEEEAFIDFFGEGDANVADSEQFFEQIDQQKLDVLSNKILEGVSCVEDAKDIILKMTNSVQFCQNQIQFLELIEKNITAGSQKDPSNNPEVISLKKDVQNDTAEVEKNEKELREFRDQRDALQKALSFTDKKLTDILENITKITPKIRAETERHYDFGVTKSFKLEVVKANNLPTFHEDGRLVTKRIIDFNGENIEKLDRLIKQNIITDEQSQLKQELEVLLLERNEFTRIKKELLNELNGNNGVLIEISKRIEKIEELNEKIDENNVKIAEILDKLIPIVQNRLKLLREGRVPPCFKRTPVCDDAIKIQLADVFTRVKNRLVEGDLRDTQENIQARVAKMFRADIAFEAGDTFGLNDTDVGSLLQIIDLLDIFKVPGFQPVNAFDIAVRSSDVPRFVPNSQEEKDFCTESFKRVSEAEKIATDLESRFAITEEQADEIAQEEFEDEVNAELDNEEQNDDSTQEEFEDEFNASLDNINNEDKPEIESPAEQRKREENDKKINQIQEQNQKEKNDERIKEVIKNIEKQFEDNRDQADKGRDVLIEVLSLNIGALFEEDNSEKQKERLIIQELLQLRNEKKEELKQLLDIAEKQFDNVNENIRDTIDFIPTFTSDEVREKAINELQEKLNINLDENQKTNLKDQTKKLFEAIKNVSDNINEIHDTIINKEKRSSFTSKIPTLIASFIDFIPQARAAEIVLCPVCGSESVNEIQDEVTTIENILKEAQTNLLILEVLDVDTSEFQDDIESFQNDLQEAQSNLDTAKNNLTTCQQLVNEARSSGACVDKLPEETSSNELIQPETTEKTNQCTALERDAQAFADQENNGILTPEDKAMICICRSENNLDLGEFCPEAPTQQTPEEDIPTPPPAGEQTPEEDVPTPPPAGEQPPEEDVPTPPPAGEQPPEEDVPTPPQQTPEEDSQVSEEEVEIENIAGPTLLEAFNNDGVVDADDFVLLFQSYENDTQAGLDAVKENIDGQVDAEDFQAFQQNFNQGPPQNVQDFENTLNTISNAFNESTKTSEKLRNIVEGAKEIQKVIPSNQQSDPQIQQKIIDILSPALDQFTNDRINNNDFKVPLIESLIETPLEDFFTDPNTEGRISIIEKFIGKASAQQLPSCPSCNTFDQILDQIVDDLQNLEDIEAALQEIINALRANGADINTLQQKLDQIDFIIGNLVETGTGIELIQNECENQVAQLKNDQVCTDQKKGGRIITDARCDQNCNVDLIRVNRQRIETTLRELSSGLQSLFAEISNEEADRANIQSNIRSVSQLIDNIENGYKQYTASFTEKTVLSCVQNKYNAMSDGLCFGENRCNACEEINNFYKIFVNESREYKAITSDILKSFVTVVDAVRSNDELQPQLQQYMNTTENLINTLIPTLTLRKETREQMKESWEACNAEVDSLTELNQCTVDGV